MSSAVCEHWGTMATTSRSPRCLLFVFSFVVVVFGGKTLKRGFWSALQKRKRGEALKACEVPKPQNPPLASEADDTDHPGERAGEGSLRHRKPSDRSLASGARPTPGVATENVNTLPEEWSRHSPRFHFTRISRQLRTTKFPEQRNQRSELMFPSVEIEWL